MQKQPQTWANKLPKSIKIWGHEYVVKRQRNLKHGNETVLGLFMPTEQEIVLNYSLMKNKSREVEVFLHEMLHGVCYNSNVFGMQEKKHELEEHTVDTVANGFTLVLKDNPSVLDYLKENLQ